MRRILAVLLVLIFAFSCVACKDTDNTSSDIDTSSLAVQAESKIESTNSTGTETTEFAEPDDYVAILQLRINPRFDIYLDKNYNVKAINPLNDEAKAIAAEYRYIVDETFETVIDDFISIGKENGYVQRNSPIYVEIIYLNKKTVTTEEFTDRIENLTSDMSKKYSAIVKFIAPASDEKDSNSSNNNSETAKPTHTHSYSAATCTKPKKCSCGATSGSALGHKWKKATCTSPKTCSVCKETEGKELGHKWSNATCTTPKTCSTCKTTKGKPLGHKWSDATCTTPKTCSVCKTTKGKTSEHKFIEGVCSVCSAKDPNFKAYDTTINGVGYNLGDVITIDIILKTADKNVEVCPCITFYKKTDSGLKKYDMVSGLVDFFGKEPTLSSLNGEALEIAEGEDFISYGIWRWFSTDFAEKEIDFSKGKVLVRQQYKVTEKGNFVFKIKDGKDSSQNNNKYTDSLSIKIY